MGFLILLCITTASTALESSMEFREGTTASLMVEGEVTVGCRFLSYPRDSLCCYSARGKEALCSDPFKPMNCSRVQQSDFSVEEREGHCILHLPNCHSLDSGQYSVSDDGNPRLNRQITVSVIPN